MGFALFFIGEYANLILMSTVTSILFLGGTSAPWALLSFLPGPLWLSLKTLLVLFTFIWVRATLPRYRYDMLMNLGWKVFLPLTLAGFLFNVVLVCVFQLLSILTNFLFISFSESFFLLTILPKQTGRKKQSSSTVEQWSHNPKVRVQFSSPLLFNPFNT